jgi:hypothetical protein
MEKFYLKKAIRGDMKFKYFYLFTYAFNILDKLKIYYETQDDGIFLIDLFEGRRKKSKENLR